jgi:hypothetical protein
MRYCRIYHIANLLLLAVYCLLATRGLHQSTLIYWIAWLVYFIVFLGMLKHNIWCIRLAVFPPLLIFSITFPFVAYNFYAFLSGNALYQDSPATIIVVFLFALLTTLPSALILGSYWIHRRAIFKMSE